MKTSSATQNDAGSDAVERAYQAVTEMVIAGNTPDGGWLREQSLAEAIGVSRTPIRQALNRLAAEGVVVLEPNRGARLITFSQEDVDSLYDLRARIEPLAAGLAVPRLTADDIEQLADLAARMEGLLDAPTLDSHEMSRLNNEFHEIFLSNAGNRHLTLAMQAVRRPAIVTRTFRKYTVRGLERSMQHHAELVDAARAGDGDWAEALMRAHILAARHAGD